MKLNNKFKYLILNQNEIKILKDSVTVLKYCSDTTNEFSAIKSNHFGCNSYHIKLRSRFLENDEHSLFYNTFKK